MKILSLITLFFINVAVLSAQPFNVEAGADGNSKNLLGKINKDGLSQGNYASWFTKKYNDYSPDKAIIDQFQNDLSTYTIELFMGTWCGDSKREVPRFYKVLEAAKFPMERLTSIAVARGGKTYKQSPGGEHEGKNIHRVPTFIFYKNGYEVNRITERPVNSLEEDIRDIVQNAYTPNYSGVTKVNALLKEVSLEKFDKKSKKLIPELQATVKNRFELNTYAKVLFSAGLKQQAIAVFELNTLLFPEEVGTYLSLANTLGVTGNSLKAIENYKKVLAIDPENEEAKSGITYLRSKI